MTKANCSLLIFSLFAWSAFAQPSRSQLDLLDASLTKLHESGMFNGVVLVAKNGKPLYKKAMGTANFQTGEPLSTSSSFNLASISKQFVAMMVMQLQEKGKLNFDDEVKAHLPSFPYDSITIRHLLTHTSGLPEYFDLAVRYNHTLDTLDGAELLGLLSEIKPRRNFEPGTQWSYCNTGYVLLAAIVEKASGMAIEDFFKENITGPLSLNDTYIYYLGVKKDPRGKHQHVYGFDRVNGKYQLNDLVRLDGVMGDGNIYSSVEDLLKWDQALYGTKLVSDETKQAAFTPVLLKDGTRHDYGFGWFIGEGGKLLSHTGSWVGFFNNIERNVAEKTTLIILTSSTDPTAMQVVKSILNGETPPMPVTQLIGHVELMDGTGLPARQESVRLKDDRIWEIGALSPFPNEKFIDGQGLVLSPGFIDTHSHHFGGLEAVPEAIPTASQGITTIVIGQDGSSYAMDTLQAFFQKRPVAVNVASYTGQSTLRVEVIGAKGLFRKAGAVEIEKMKALLHGEMQKGSFGLATGLEYESAFYSNREEVLQLAKVAAEYGGRYMSHIRSEDIHMDEAIDEIIEIGRLAKIPVQVSHIKIAKRANWGSSPQLLAQLQKARSEGIDITADCYPYDFWNSTLKILFPNRDYANAESAEFAVNQLFDPDQSVLIRFAPDKSYAGKTISEIASMRQEPPSKTLMALIAMADEFERLYPESDEDVETIMGKSMDEKDVVNFLVWPSTNICSDGSSGGHPRGHGSFPRILGRYVREQKRMPLETAIHKMTGLSAAHVGISDRGIIANGNFADLVLFDPNTIIDHADVKNGKALSSGIEMVWVNGQVVYQSQKPTGKYPGVLIKRQNTASHDE